IGCDLRGPPQLVRPAIEAYEHSASRGDVLLVDVMQQVVDVVERAAQGGLAHAAHGAQIVEQPGGGAASGDHGSPAAAPACDTGPQSGGRGRFAKGVHEPRRAAHGGESVNVMTAGALECRMELRAEIQ